MLKGKELDIIYAMRADVPGFVQIPPKVQLSIAKWVLDDRRVQIGCALLKAAACNVNPPEPTEGE